MTRRSFLVAATAGCLLVACACARPVQTAVDLSVTGRTSATASIAAIDSFVMVVWGATILDGATDVYSAVSRDAGRTFAPAVRVNDQAGDARLNGEQPPHVVLVAQSTGEPRATVVWTSKHASGTVLLLAHSDDGGRTFGSSTLVPDTDAPGNRGWESIAADAAGLVRAVWLDHRDTVRPADGTPMSHDDHAAHMGSGVQAAEKSKLYFAALDGASLPRSITGGVCYCCKTAMAVGHDGAVYLAWRHVYPGDLRDIAFAWSRDGGNTFSAPLRISEDQWEINGCPENGPAMVVDEQQTVHVVWPTQIAGPPASMALFHASTRDGKTFSPRRQIATSGSPAHVQLAIDRLGNLVLLWEEVRESGRVVAFSTQPRGAEDFGAETVLSSERGTYPAVAAVAGGTIAAWTNGPSSASVIRVQRLPKT